jgi:hypothetical protein
MDKKKWTYSWKPNPSWTPDGLTKSFNFGTHIFSVNFKDFCGSCFSDKEEGSREYKLALLEHLLYVIGCRNKEHFYKPYGDKTKRASNQINKIRMLIIKHLL